MPVDQVGDCLAVAGKFASGDELVGEKEPAGGVGYGLDRIVIVVFGYMGHAGIEFGIGEELVEIVGHLASVADWDYEAGLVVFDLQGDAAGSVGDDRDAFHKTF